MSIRPPGTLLVNALSTRGGGGKVYMDNLLRHVPARLKPRLVVLASAGSAWPANADGIRFVTSRFASRNVLFRMLHECVAMPWLLRRWRVRLYMSPNSVAPPWAPRRMRLAAAFQNRLPPGPLYPWGFQRVRLWLLRRLQLAAARRARLLLFCTRDHAASMRRCRRRADAKTLVIPHGLEPMFLDDAPAPAGMPDDYVLYASSLLPYKRHAEVLSAWQALRRRRPGGGEKLVFVGAPWPPQLKRLRSQIRRCGLEREVVIAGAREHADMPSIYRHAKLHVFASMTESFGIILLEKMASGVAVLCARDDGLREVAGDGAAWFDPGDAEALAGLMARYLDDPAARAALAAKGRARAAGFSWRRSAERTWRSLDEMLFADAGEAR